jgi:DNA-binding CsgD family transcriptional regulator
MAQEAATIDSRAMHEAVARLYGAVTAPSEWPAALENVSGILHADHAIVFAVGPDAREPFVACSGMDFGHAARFCTPECLRLGEPFLRALPAARVISSADVISDRELESTAYYDELIRPAKGFYSLNASVEVPGRAGTFVNFCRPRKAGAFDVARATTLQAILPHFAAALELMHRLQVVQQHNNSLLQLLDQVDSGVILVDDEASEPRFINGRAARILTDADGLALGAAGLLAATPTATRRLRQAIAGMMPLDDGRPRPGAAAERRARLCLPRPSRRSPLLLSLYPVWRLDGAAPSGRRPSVGIFVSEPDVCPPIDRDALADAFRLTPREAALADVLASGHDLKGAAQALAIGIGTARNHLKHVFEKTDTHSQSKLMAVLRGFVGPRT